MGLPFDVRPGDYKNENVVHYFDVITCYHMLFNVLTNVGIGTYCNIIYMQPSKRYARVFIIICIIKQYYEMI